MEEYAKYTTPRMNLNVLKIIIQTHSENQITKIIKFLTKNKIINNIQCRTLYSTKFPTYTLNFNTLICFVS